MSADSVLKLFNKNKKNYAIFAFVVTMLTAVIAGSLRASQKSVVQCQGLAQVAHVGRVVEYNGTTRVDSVPLVEPAEVKALLDLVTANRNSGVNVLRASGESLLVGASASDADGCKAKIRSVIDPVTERYRALIDKIHSEYKERLSDLSSQIDRKKKILDQIDLGIKAEKPAHIVALLYRAELSSDLSRLSGRQFELKQALSTSRNRDFELFDFQLMSQPPRLRSVLLLVLTGGIAGLMGALIFIWIDITRRLMQQEVDLHAAREKS